MSNLDTITENEIIFDSFTMISDAIKNGEITEKSPDKSEGA